MHLYDVPLIFVLIGLALYVVLAGADFGAGLWQLTAGSGRRGRAHPRPRPRRDRPGLGGQPRLADLRAHGGLDRLPDARSARSPRRCRSRCSSPALGIIFRGAAYALRAGTATPRELRTIDTRLALSSILTPFALGAAVGRDRLAPGAGGQRRRPPDLELAEPDLDARSACSRGRCPPTWPPSISRPTPSRLDEPELAARFRTRALGAGAARGRHRRRRPGRAALATRTRSITSSSAGDGLVGLIVSRSPALATLALVWRGRFEHARVHRGARRGGDDRRLGAGAEPRRFLPGLTVQQAAAPHDTLVAGRRGRGRGRRDPLPVARAALPARPQRAASTTSSRRRRAAHAVTRPALLSRLAPRAPGQVAGACLVVGFGLLTIADAALGARDRRDGPVRLHGARVPRVDPGGAGGAVGGRPAPSRPSFPPSIV